MITPLAWVRLNIKRSKIKRSSVALWRTRTGWGLKTEAWARETMRLIAWISTSSRCNEICQRLQEDWPGSSRRDSNICRISTSNLPTAQRLSIFSSRLRLPCTMATLNPQISPVRTRLFKKTRLCSTLNLIFKVKWHNRTLHRFKHPQVSDSECHQTTSHRRRSILATIQKYTSQTWTARTLTLERKTGNKRKCSTITFLMRWHSVRHPYKQPRLSLTRPPRPLSGLESKETMSNGSCVSWEMTLRASSCQSALYLCWTSKKT